MEYESRRSIAAEAKTARAVYARLENVTRVTQRYVTRASNNNNSPAAGVVEPPRALLCSRVDGKSYYEIIINGIMSEVTRYVFEQGSRASGVVEGRDGEEKRDFREGYI